MHNKNLYRYILKEYFGDKLKEEIIIRYIARGNDYMEISYVSGEQRGVYLIDYKKFNKLRDKYLLSKIKHIKENING